MDEYSNVLPLYVSFNVPAFLFYPSIKPSRIKANTYNKSTLSFITFSKYVFFFFFSRWRGALQEDQKRVSYNTHQWRRCRQEPAPLTLLTGVGAGVGAVGAEEQRAGAGAERQRAGAGALVSVISPFLSEDPICSPSFPLSD